MGMYCRREDEYVGKRVMAMKVPGKTLFISISFMVMFIHARKALSDLTEMVRQSQRQHFVDQDKSTASRNRSKTKKMVVDWSLRKPQSSITRQALTWKQACMEPRREEEERTTKKHETARRK